MSYDLIAQKSMTLVGGTRVTQLISVKDRAGDEIRQQVLEVEITPTKLTTTKYDVAEYADERRANVSIFHFSDAGTGETISVFANPRGNPRITDGII